MLGSLFTMLCVNDADGRLMRDDCTVRGIGKSSALIGVFVDELTAAATDAAASTAVDDDDDIAAGTVNDATNAGGGPVGINAANADGFERFDSNGSLQP